MCSPEHMEKLSGNPSTPLLSGRGGNLPPLSRGHYLPPLIWRVRFDTGNP